MTKKLDDSIDRTATAAIFIYSSGSSYADSVEDQPLLTIDEYRHAEKISSELYDLIWRKVASERSE